MFAVPIRERDAPGYHKVILQPQDLKSIRAAINHGNKAAAQEAAALPGGDPGLPHVPLPVNQDIMPPKGIINSNQLDRELAHMMANAVMYNPDPCCGLGSSFLVKQDKQHPDGQDGGSAQDTVVGYKVDEFGVVKDTRAMFTEVSKIVAEFQGAEVQRGAQPGASFMTHNAHYTQGTNTRQASVATGHDELGLGGASEHAGDDGDDHTGTEAESTSMGNAVKRRRTARN